MRSVAVSCSVADDSRLFAQAQFIPSGQDDWHYMPKSIDYWCFAPLVRGGGWSPISIYLSKQLGLIRKMSPSPPSWKTGSRQSIVDFGMAMSHSSFIDGRRPLGEYSVHRIRMYSAPFDFSGSFISAQGRNFKNPCSSAGLVVGVADIVSFRHVEAG